MRRFVLATINLDQTVCHCSDLQIAPEWMKNHVSHLPNHIRTTTTTVSTSGKPTKGCIDERRSLDKAGPFGGDDGHRLSLLSQKTPQGKAPTVSCPLLQTKPSQ